MRLELRKPIPGGDWKSFIAIRQEILRESWINTEWQSTLEYSDNPPDTLFKTWSVKQSSYTIDNLIKILKRMGHDRLVALIMNDRIYAPVTAAARETSSAPPQSAPKSEMTNTPLFERLKEFGFNSEDIKESLKYNNNLQSAIDWILAEKPAKN